MQNKHEEEWEPGGALRGALEGMRLRPETGRGDDLARLKPHVEEALGELDRLERRRGLSDRERVRAEALRTLSERAREVG